MLTKIMFWMSAYKWIVISSTLISLAVGGCKLYNSIWNKGYNSAFNKIEKANKKRQAKQNREADNLRDSASRKAADAVGCKGEKCVEIFDGIFKKGWRW